jgi:hypothetical protein
MKTYIVKTQSANNEMLLHSLMKKEYSTTDYNDALNVFNQEIKQLKKEYKTIEQLEYSPSDKEMNNAIFCTLYVIEDDELNAVEDSEYFFE